MGKVHSALTLGGWWEETDFHETQDTGFLLARLEQALARVPRYKPLSVGVVLLDLVPAIQHQPDLFDAARPRRQKLSPLIDRINTRYGRGAIGFGLPPPTVRAFSGHARVPAGAGEVGVLSWSAPFYPVRRSLVSKLTIVSWSNCQ